MNITPQTRRRNRLPRDRAREKFQELLDKNPQMTLIEQLQNYYPHGEDQGPLFMQILNDYVPVAQIRSLLFNRYTRAAAEPVLWARIDLSFDSIFEGQSAKGQFEAFFDSIEARRKTDSWHPEWIQEISIHDSPLMTARSRLSAHNIHAWNWKFGALVKEFSALRSFTWNSTIPFSPALLESLGDDLTCLRECQFIIHSTMATRLCEGQYILIGDKEQDAQEMKPSSSKATSRPDKRKLSVLSDIVLLEATSLHVSRLARVIGRYFDNVRDVRIFGDLSHAGRQRAADDATPLPSRSQSDLSLPPSQIQAPGTISVQRLSLVGLGIAAKYIVSALIPQDLIDLKIDHCVVLRHILQPLTGKAANLGGFDVHLPDIHDYPDTERGPQKQDQMAVCNFLRSGTCRLKALQICGQFTSDNFLPGNIGEIDNNVGQGWSWRALNQKAQLFSAIQAHLPWLEQLSVIDGFNYEFTQFTVEEMREIGLCAPRLIDFRFRATPAWPGPGREQALLSYLSTVLPYLQQVHCIGLFGNTFVPDISEFEQNYHQDDKDKSNINVFDIYQKSNFDFSHYAQLIRREIVATVAAVKAAHPGMQLRLLGYEEAASQWPAPFLQLLESLDPSSQQIITPGKGVTPSGLWKSPKSPVAALSAAAAASSAAFASTTPSNPPVKGGLSVLNSGKSSLLSSFLNFTRSPLKRSNFTMPAFLNMNPLLGRDSNQPPRRGSLPGDLLSSGVPSALEFSSSTLVAFTAGSQQPSASLAPAGTDHRAPLVVPMKRSKDHGQATPSTKKPKTRDAARQPVKSVPRTPQTPPNQTSSPETTTKKLTDEEKFAHLRTYFLKAQEYADANPSHEWYWVVTPTPQLLPIPGSTFPSQSTDTTITTTSSSSSYHTPRSQPSLHAYSNNPQTPPSRPAAQVPKTPPNAFSSPGGTLTRTPSTLRTPSAPGTGSRLQPGSGTGTSPYATTAPTQDRLAETSPFFRNGSQGIRLLAHIRGGDGGDPATDPATDPAVVNTSAGITSGSNTDGVVRRSTRPARHSRNTRTNRNTKNAGEGGAGSSTAPAAAAAAAAVASGSRAGGPGRARGAVATGSGNGWLFQEHLRGYAIMLGIKQRGVERRRRVAAGVGARSKSRRRW
ncbi:hypothetical protein L228DRAFT_235197 [Xylona heveae TC161]|uniref:Uncharacterized protein n=1 Tax=Xylona heveae (strain CBS 132557 / TC161) TaxID=1328760 RepID=A0A165JD90_XYLHT|nr:hypothetical protein L228DRAFT_235197 [Xylona heveae TC161]KZF26084.1 hypothetical protein L228DRAFT_235197 [Xylona heveae TC161]